MALSLAGACAADVEPRSSVTDEAAALDAGELAPVFAPVSFPIAAPAGPLTGAPQGGAPPPEVRCSDDPELARQGCPCNELPHSPCWTGPSAQRHVGACRDGVHECIVSDEFRQWGPCVGEVQECGEPAPPPPPGDCPCVPGALIGCDEDCAAGIICSITAEKSCLPDGTWGPCRETSPTSLSGILNGTVTPGDLLTAQPPPLDLSSLGNLNVPITGALGDVGRCRSFFHGCAEGPVTNPLALAFAGMKESYIGDCSKQFTCGHAPSPSLR